MHVLKHARKAMKFYPLAEPVQRRRQAARYAKSIVMLGDKWVLAKKVRRNENGYS